MKNNTKEKGITLIALIVTIIVLLILVGVSAVTLVGENGILTQASWSKWITEYRSVEEAEELYALDKDMGKYGKIESKVTSRAGEERTENEESEETTNIKYAITSKKIEVESGSTLEDTIKQINGEEYVATLYEVDKEKLEIEDIKKEYAIDIETGKVYDVEGHKKGGAVYHVPEKGIRENGEVVEGEDTEAPSNFEIEANYNEDEEQLEIKVGEVTDNKSTTFKYEYHIKEVTVNEETGEVTETEKEEVVKTTTQKSYYDEEIEDGTYKIYVVVYDETENSKKSDNEEIVTVKRPEQVTTTTSLTMNNPIVVTIGKRVTIQVLKDAETENEVKVSNGSFNWNIADTNIATINTKGQVTGKAIGTTTVTATLKSDTTKTLTATVEVKDLIVDIWTREDLEKFRDEVNSGSTYAGLEVNQWADIDLGGDTNNWTPIGWGTAYGTSTSKHFRGTYNGNNHKITGLYINATTAAQGLFGNATGANIKNINVENGYVYTTSHTAGGVLGWGRNVTIDSCTFSGSVTTKGRAGTTDNWGCTGGIVGNLYYTGTNKITNCNNYGTVDGTWRYSGGIVGICQKGDIINCKNTGNVIGASSTGRNKWSFRNLLEW